MKPQLITEKEIKQTLDKWYNKRPSKRWFFAVTGEIGQEGTVFGGGPRKKGSWSIPVLLHYMALEVSSEPELFNALIDAVIAANKYRNRRARANNR